MPIELVQATNLNAIAEQEYATEKNKVKTTTLDSCIGVSVRIGDEFRVIHLVLFAIYKPAKASDADPFFNETDAQAVFNLMDQFRQDKTADKFDEVLIFGNVEFWSDSQSQGIRDAYAKLVELLQSKNTEGHFKDDDDGKGEYSLEIKDDALKATNLS